VIGGGERPRVEKPVDILQTAVDLAYVYALVALLLGDGVDKHFVTLIELLLVLSFNMGARHSHIEIDLHLPKQIQAALGLWGFGRLRIRRVVLAGRPSGEETSEGEDRDGQSAGWVSHTSGYALHL